MYNRSATDSKSEVTREFDRGRFMEIGMESGIHLHVAETAPVHHAIRL